MLPNLSVPTTTPPTAVPVETPRQQNKKEPAVLHAWNPTTKEWVRTTVWVTVDAKPFTEGSMRWCFRITNHSLPAGEQQQVGKLYKNPMEPNETYFTEVEMTSTCADLADEFNKRGPPKKIKFLRTQVLEYTYRRWPSGKLLLMTVEPYLTGDYKKYSNNYGFVGSEDRNTPHAFSHFTYQYSNGRTLVCDMQGVGDTYTDPQIHTPELRFGVADMGHDGMVKFFSTHKCNGICQFLGLHAQQSKTDDSGTKVQPRTRAYSQQSLPSKALTTTPTSPTTPTTPVPALPGLPLSGMFSSSFPMIPMMCTPRLDALTA